MSHPDKPEQSSDLLTPVFGTVNYGTGVCSGFVVKEHNSELKKATQYTKIFTVTN